MPKLKTKRSLKKRFKFTKKGKIKRSKAFKSHLLTKKSRRRKRALKRAGIVSREDAKVLKRLMPYGV